MKKSFLCLALCVAMCACELLDGAPGDGAAQEQDCAICLKFHESSYVSSKASSPLQIDTNSFILTVTGPDGGVLYSGLYCDSPESLIVEPGTYNVKVVSDDSFSPAFDAPLWGDEQLVVVEKGRKSLVELLCRQMNSGVRLHIASEFLTEYPSSSLLLKSDAGKLLYSYKEKRTAYFPAGKLNLVMSTGGSDETLLTRTLAPGEIFCLNLNVAAQSSESSGIRIRVDTTRTYTDETFVLGGESGGKGDSPENAYTISQAREAVGQKGVWVAGYIVGGDLTKSNVSFQGPFKSASNMAIGPRATTSSRESCLSVELKSGAVRDELNLVAHPDMLGRFVYLKGDIDPSYFGLTGIKNVTDFQY